MDDEPGALLQEYEWDGFLDAASQTPDRTPRLRPGRPRTEDFTPSHTSSQDIHEITSSIYRSMNISPVPSHPTLHRPTNFPASDPHTSQERTHTPSPPAGHAANLDRQKDPGQKPQSRASVRSGRPRIAEESISRASGGYDMRHIQRLDALDTDVELWLSQLQPPGEDQSNSNRTSAIDSPLENIETDALLSKIEKCIAASHYTLKYEVTRSSQTVREAKRATFERLQALESRVSRWRMIFPKKGPIEYECSEFPALLRPVRTLLNQLA